MKKSPALSSVEKGSLCAGCGLCEGVAGGAVTLESRGVGFPRPLQHAPLTADQERSIAECCPGLKVEPWPNTEERPAHASWGPTILSATGFASDEGVRFRCSSGGALSALAIHALERGLIDQVLHIGADSDKPFGNTGKISRSTLEILEGAGSRYAPSSPLQSIDELLEAGVPTLFIGKPCDVSALKRLGRLDARVDAVFPIKLSFFCGGVPSEEGARAITRAMGLKPEEIVEFDFRGNGWPGLTVARDRAGREAKMKYEESWGRYLSSQVQFRCRICPDPVGGVADIACADAWYGGESGYPQFDEADGRSLILVRTEIGRQLFESASRSGAIFYEQLDPSEIDLMQPAQARRKRLIAARMAACKIAGRPVPDTSGLRVGAATRKASALALAKEFMGTMRRIIQGRI